MITNNPAQESYTHKQETVHQLDELRLLETSFYWHGQKTSSLFSVVDHGKLIRSFDTYEEAVVIFESMYNQDKNFNRSGSTNYDNGFVFMSDLSSVDSYKNKHGV